MNMMKKKKDAMMAAKKRGKEEGCTFCKTKTVPNWQDYEKLGDFLSPRARIIGSPYTGVCSKHQKRLAQSIKHARHLGLLPFTTQ
jgi:small subunit ribosomal protein S18